MGQVCPARAGLPVKMASSFGVPEQPKNFKFQITNFKQITMTKIQKTPINLAPQESLLPLETMSQFAEPVIPDEAA